jgi:hypothetical protein
MHAAFRPFCNIDFAWKSAPYKAVGFAKELGAIRVWLQVLREMHFPKKGTEINFISQNKGACQLQGLS